MEKIIWIILLVNFKKLSIFTYSLYSSEIDRVTTWQYYLQILIE